MQIETIFTGSSGNLYILTTSKGNKYLIECGRFKGEIIKRLYNHKLTINNFKGCFITHGHSDHCESAFWVNKYMPIYTNYSLMEKYKYKGEYLKALEKKIIDDLTIIPFNVEHGNIENYGYIFKDEKDTVLFATDFSTFDTNLSKIKFTKIFIECNWTKERMEEALNDEDNFRRVKYERQFNTHCSLQTLIDILNTLDLINCYKIVLIHRSREVCSMPTALMELRSRFAGIEFEFAVSEGA